MANQEQLDRIEQKLDEMLAFRDQLMALMGKFGGKYLSLMTKVK
jgi:hypothetical protein